MQFRRVPTALFAVGALAGTGGAALVAKGAQNQLDARKREDVAEQQYQARKELSDLRRAATDDRLAAFAGLQRESYTDAVQRMVEFLHRHERQVRESDRLLVDGIDLVLMSMPSPTGHDMDAGAWFAGAIGTAATGTGTAALISEAVNKYGNASTGTPISGLSGAAKQKAARAFLGGGSLKRGGGGIALGTKARNVTVVGSALLTAGIFTKIQGTRALTHAQQYEADRAVDCAQLDVTDAHLRAVDQRAAEISSVLTHLRAHAVSALDELESVEFNAQQHAALFQKTMTLVKAVQDVAATPLITSDGSLTDKSETLTVKYRSMTAEVDGG